MTGTASGKRLIRRLRDVTNVETFIASFLRDGLHWPVAELSPMHTVDGSALRRLEFNGVAPPIRVFLSGDLSAFKAADVHVDGSSLVICIRGVENEISFQLRDGAPESQSTWMILNSEALANDECILGEFLHRLTWPRTAAMHDAASWCQQWRSAFEKTDLRRRFLRGLRKAKRPTQSPAEFQRAIVDRLLGRTSHDQNPNPFLDRFPFSPHEDTDRESRVTLDPSILADLHESGDLRTTANLDDASKARKNTGSFFTPPEIARLMCRESLCEFLADTLVEEDIDTRGVHRRRVISLLQSDSRCGDVSETEITTLRQAVLDCRVCDPAVGGGMLLIAMLHEMASALITLDRMAGSSCEPVDESSIRKPIAESCLFGIDIQPAALEVCRLRIQLAVGADDDTRQACKPNLRCADAILDDLPDIFETPMPFDIVIANPPYRSYGLRSSRSEQREWTDIVRTRFPNSAEYKISLYALFFELGLRLAGKGGVLCFLTPDSFLLGRYFSKLRRLLVERTAIARLITFSRDFWSAGIVGRPTITVLRNTPGDGEFDAVLADEATSLRTLRHSQADFATNPHHRFQLFFSETSRDFAKAIEANSVPLSELAKITSGIRSRIGQQAIIGTEASGDDWKPGLISGSQVRPYCVEWRGHFLQIVGANLYAGGWDAKSVGSHKLLIRQTGDSLIAAIDLGGYYHLNNIHALLLRSRGVSLAYLWAVLNSRLMNRYYHLISLERGRPMAQTDIETLSRLPIRQPDPQTARMIDALVVNAERPEVRAALDARIEEIYDPQRRFREYLDSDEEF